MASGFLLPLTSLMIFLNERSNSEIMKRKNIDESDGAVQNGLTAFLTELSLSSLKSYFCIQGFSQVCKEPRSGWLQGMVHPSSYGRLDPLIGRSCLICLRRAALLYWDNASFLLFSFASRKK